MKKTLEYGYKSLQFAWRANGFAAILEIVSRIYDSTFYPFIQVYLLSRVLDLFTDSSKPQIHDIYWIIVGYLIASILKLALKSFVEVKEMFLMEKIEAYIDIKINKKLAELDPATFEKSDFQDLISQLEGIKGTLQMHLSRFIGLIDAIFKFITAAVVVSTIFPLFVPAVIIATIPSYLAFPT